MSGGKIMVENYISPRFRWDKLNNPCFDDLVNVFEDRIRNWLIEPAKSLLQIKNGDIPAISLLFTYFEGIQIYISGKDSKGASAKFFIDGVLGVLGSSGIKKPRLKNMAKAIYAEGRCGFFHNGMSGKRIQYSEIRNEALIVTLPKINCELDFNGEVESIVINPKRFCWCVERHFNKYISDLKNLENKSLRENFNKIVDMKWDIEGKDLIIGMTEEEFKNS